MEDLRFWSIREVGKLHDTSRLAGTHLHALRNEVNDLKARLDTKAEAAAVVSEMDRLRGDVTEEFRKTRLEIEGTFRELTAQAQFIMQKKATRYLGRRRRITCGADHAVRCASLGSVTCFTPPFIK